MEPSTCDSSRKKAFFEKTYVHNGLDSGFFDEDEQNEKRDGDNGQDEHRAARETPSAGKVEKEHERGKAAEKACSPFDIEMKSCFFAFLFPDHGCGHDERQKRYRDPQIENCPPTEQIEDETSHYRTRHETERICARQYTQTLAPFRSGEDRHDDGHGKRPPGGSPHALNGAGKYQLVGTLCDGAGGYAYRIEDKTDHVDTLSAFGVAYARKGEPKALAHGKIGDVHPTHHEESV